MTKSRKLAWGALVGAVALGLGAFALLGTGHSLAGAAPGTPGPARADEERLVYAAVARFAARLGTDEATVNAAFVGAVGDTVDQAARDGTLTQAQATEIKGEVSRLGLKGVLVQSTGAGKPRASEQELTVLRAIWGAAAGTLGLDPGEMKRQLSTGQSMADLAQVRGIPVQRLKDAMLTAGRAQLEADVSAGTLTRAQADERSRDLSQEIDRMVTSFNRSPLGTPVPGKP